MTKTQKSTQISIEEYLDDLKNIFTDAEACIIASYDELQVINLKILEQKSIFKAPYKRDYVLYAIKSKPYYGLILAIVYNNRVIFLDTQIHYHHYNELNFIDAMLKNLNNRIFSINELKNGKIKNYWDYCNKDDFIRNCLTKAFSSVSIFHIEKYTPQEQLIVNKGLFSKSCFKYFDFKNDLDFIENIHQINEGKYKKLLKNLDFFRNAIHCELANHEAGYTMYYESVENAVNALGLRMDELTTKQKKILHEELNKLAKTSQ